MPFLIIAIALPLILWGAISVVRGSLFLSVAVFFVATCVFPAEFFSVDMAGLTWTIDRLCLVGIAAQLVLRWRRGQLQLRKLESLDVAMALFMLWLVARTITQPLGSVLPGQPATLMHLVNGYLIPFFLYAGLRTSKLEPQQLKWPLFVLLGLGLYLGITAILEMAKLWGLVFPRFIGDPTIGIHFGRARGPMLQSVRLGVTLLACLTPLIIYTIWLQPLKRVSWGACLAIGPILGAGVMLTLTRSVWMGLGLVAVLLTGLCMQGIPRRAAFVGMLFAALAIVIVKGDDLVSFKREYSAAETRESTYMRAAFAYVSLEMFRDRPVMGFGFNQFQVYNRPYLADRSTDIRLESIRGYVHHNSFLSLLVDLGIVGFGCYAFVGLAAVIQCYILWQAREAPKWARGLSLLALCIGGVHLIQMAFHEVSFSTIENGFLFAALGLVVAAKQQFCSHRHQVAPHSPSPRRSIAWRN
ncbi:MAG: O-antigen ligase family protein [Pirellulaceae bacterium]|jgi:O-antigen ligase|nr:O-antigen ligase family protein [Pirellulaceae bacterium]